MTVDFKFNIGQTVNIKALNRHGVVLALFHAKYGNEYNIRYFNNYDEAATEYFFEDELASVDSNVKRIK